MKKLRWLLAFLMSGAGLWFALRGTDWTAMGTSLKKLNTPWFLVLVPLAMGGEYLLRTLRWRTLLAPLRVLPLKDLFPVTAAGFFLNNVLPFRAGELARLYWTGRKSGVPLSGCLGVLAADRLFDMVSLLSIVIVVLVGRSDLLGSKSVVWVFGTVTAGGLAGLVILARFPEASLRWMGRARFPIAVTRIAERFSAGAGALRSGKTFLAMYGLSLFFWTMTLVLFRILGGVFGLSLSWLDAGWLIVALCLGAIVPAAPGYIGTLEAAGVAALGLLGYDRNTAFPFIFVLHICQILSTALWGVPSLLCVGSFRDAKASPDVS